MRADHVPVITGVFDVFRPLYSVVPMSGALGEQMDEIAQFGNRIILPGPGIVFRRVLFNFVGGLHKKTMEHFLPQACPLLGNSCDTALLTVAASLSIPAERLAKRGFYLAITRKPCAQLRTESGPLRRGETTGGRGRSLYVHVAGIALKRAGRIDPLTSLALFRFEIGGGAKPFGSTIFEVAGVIWFLRRLS